MGKPQLNPRFEEAPKPNALFTLSTETLQTQWKDLFFPGLKRNKKNKDPVLVGLGLAGSLLSNYARGAILAPWAQGMWGQHCPPLLAGHLEQSWGASLLPGAPQGVFACLPSCVPD